MGIVRSLWMTKRDLKKIQPVECDKDHALSFICDEVMLIPSGKSPYFEFYRNMNVVLFKEGEPTVRLLNDSDVLFIEPSEYSLKIDSSRKNNLIRIFPTIGRIRVDWDGTSLHINRFGDIDETV